MLQAVDNSEFSRPMDLFKEIDDLSDLFLLEKNTKLSCPEEGYEDLQNKYSSLHENYAKEIENSKKVEKCLIKCLKFYSKLSKKYEVQKQIIRDLEESIKEKVSNLEEAQKNEEKMRGLIEVYKTERTVYAGQTSMQLRKEKELLLDICCKLISESVKSHSTSTLSNLLLRKFRKDLTDEKIILLKSKSVKLKEEVANLEEIENALALKPEHGALKDEFKTDNKYSSDVSKVEIKEYIQDITSDQSHLGQLEVPTEESSVLENENSQEDSDKLPSAETEQEPSLPSLEELPLSLEPIYNEEEHQSDVECNYILRECDMLQERSSLVEGRKSDVRDTRTENMESQCSGKLGEPTVASGNYSDAQERPTQPSEHSTKQLSIFDICDECPKSSDSREENKKQENESEETEFFSEVSFVSEHKSEEISLLNNTNKLNLDVTYGDDDDDDDDNNDSTCTYEKEMVKIFKEMSSMRLLSPIRETNSSATDIEACRAAPSESKNCVDGNAGLGLKRNAYVQENGRKSKKFKPEEETPTSCLLDSIMSAMSIQNEEFKAKKFVSKGPGESGEVSEGSSCEAVAPRLKVYSRRARKETGKCEGKPAISRLLPGRTGGRDRQQTLEKLVSEEIKNFVSAPISCKEDADRNVKQCISVLMKKPEDVIAKCIVTAVLENIDEAVEIFERPAPPLTKTQHRLVVLLSVFRSLDWDSEKICTKILSIISEKLFPDNFFWPDDSIEAATRFYAALCRARNDLKTLWKFCLSAMTDMRQRCPLVVFTVLQTWPDVLHDASRLKNNTLAVTVVNIFLHMPQTEGLRNGNQKRKLIALKHLLLNFYQFKMEENIEGHAKKVLEGIRREETGSEKSLVLLSKCRDRKWTLKNIVPELKLSLAAWSEGNVSDAVASTILSVIKQICPILTQENNAAVKELALCLSQILTSGKKSHNSEVSVIEVLLLLKQYPEARKAICEWIPKTAIDDSLRNEIINASAENVLRELKWNRKKETKNLPIKKKQWKKPRGKKSKGKKRKKNEQKSKA